MATQAHPGRAGRTRARRPPAAADPGLAFLRTAWPCRLSIACWVGLAAVLAARDGVPAAWSDLRSLLGVLCALLALAVLDTELGRAAERGRLVGNRPHKGLSAWPFAAVLLSPSPLAVLVVVPVYVLSRARGIRVQLWKWVGSGAIAVVAGAAADVAAGSVDLHGTSGLLPVVVAGAVFLGVSALGFWCAALTGDPVDETWLRTQLVRPSYYGNEAAVLCQAAVVAVLHAQSPAMLLLVVPSYAVLQRALLHAPLTERADHDAKTGLLNHGAWTSAAGRELALPRPVGLLLVDLDHFKAVNDRHGHLVGDLALAAAARAIKRAVRPVDVVGRFGGEEFCVLLPDVHGPEGLAIAELVRAAVADVRLEGHPDLRLSASVGLHAVPRATPDALPGLLTAADRALLGAKAGGRDRVAASLPAPRTGPDGGTRPAAASAPARSDRPN